MKIHTSDGIEVIPKDETVLIDESRVKVGESISINADEVIVIDTILRSYGAGQYFGELDIYNTEQGFVIVNTLPVDTYLRYVVPSEMPFDFGIEAIKAQTVCARNFAVQHINNPAYPQFNAHLDDSVRFQVYNNQISNDIVDKAINDTKNKVLTYNNQVISTYYFSTSWGHTTDLSLWGDEDCEYYKAKEMSLANEYIDLTTEESFKEYLVNGSNAYEKDEPWYRWTYNISIEDIKHNINIHTDYEVDTIEKIEIKSRRPGGSVSQLLIFADKKEIVFTKESDIRNIFTPFNSNVFRNDNSVIETYNKCPSSYFLIEPVVENEKITGYVLSGGGCGHGLGMSQYCAKHLDAEGYSYDEILEFFFPNTELIDFDCI